MKQSTSFEEPDHVETPVMASPELARVEVPSLVGTEPHVAVERLCAVGLVPVVESRGVADESLVGVVCAQEPDAGSDLESGGAVVVVVGVPAVREQADEEPELLPVEEEDDWFDIDLPQNVVHTLQAVGAPAPQPLERSTGEDGDGLRRGGREVRVRSTRPTRRAVAAAAVALVAVVLLAIVLRSSGPGDAAAPTTQPAHSPRMAVTVPRRAPWSRPPRLSRAHAMHGRRRLAAHDRSPVRAPASVARLPAAVKQPPRVSPVAPRSGGDCEFCLEHPSQ